MAYSTLICLLVGLYEFFKFMVFITMTCYNAFDLGIVKALRTIWLMYIPRDYLNDAAENRVRQKPCNGQDNPPPSPRMPFAPPLPQVPNVLEDQYLLQVQQIRHGSDSRRSINKPL